ncbi:NAD(P)H-dependent oxidoreductase [Staphylococcus succinus]|uniref:NADPH-dependent FMN reductase n=1 Tax=Staphylococcus succinus TaxID=61015 RepID=UPI002DB731F6|nr:NADPH-dependent FMN reductase [Staphylococcus succinus]MEB7462887.1 NAD(P)H-dependent oxidoreductase [Staphylococcus succinus]
MKKFMALCGSNHRNSQNQKLLLDLKQSLSTNHKFQIYNKIYDFPIFHSNIEYEDYPTIIKNFMNDIEQSDHIVIATPEYIKGVPAALKNALEWLVASAVLYDKPVSFIVNSPHGESCYQSLLKHLKILNPQMQEEGMLLISGKDRLRNEDGTFCSLKTQKEVAGFLTFLEKN